MQKFSQFKKCCSSCGRRWFQNHGGIKKREDRIRTFSPKCTNLSCRYNQLAFLLLSSSIFYVCLWWTSIHRAALLNVTERFIAATRDQIGCKPPSLPPTCSSAAHLFPIQTSEPFLKKYLKKALQGSLHNTHEETKLSREFYLILLRSFGLIPAEQQTRCQHRCVQTVGCVKTPKYNFRNMSSRRESLINKVYHISVD